jgi:hypothetical protein
VSTDLAQIISGFQKRWQELNKIPKFVNVAARKLDPAIDTPVVESLVEHYGDIVVYPSPSFPGWWDVKDPSDIIVSFCGDLAHRNAVAFAKNWGKS